MPAVDVLALDQCAGTDILMGDPLGHMQVSAAGVQQRDQLVWQAAAQACGLPLPVPVGFTRR